MSGTSLSSGDRAMNKDDKKHTLRELTCVRERKEKQINDFLIWHIVICANEINKAENYRVRDYYLARMIKEGISH